MPKYPSDRTVLMRQSILKDKQSCVNMGQPSAKTNKPALATKAMCGMFSMCLHQTCDTRSGLNPYKALQ